MLLIQYTITGYEWSNCVY